MARALDELVPVLAIVTGGVIGALSFAPLVATSVSDVVLDRDRIARPAAVTARSDARRPGPTNGVVPSAAVIADQWPVYIDGVRVHTLPPNLSADDFERVEIVSGDAAMLLYGPEAASGVIRISLR